MKRTNPQKVTNDIRQDLQQGQGAARQLTNSLSGTNAQQVQNEIQQSVNNQAAGAQFTNSLAAAQAQAANSLAGAQAQATNSLAGAQATNSLSGTNAQAVKQEIQQDLSQP